MYTGTLNCEYHSGIHHSYIEIEITKKLEILKSRKSGIFESTIWHCPIFGEHC